MERKATGFLLSALILSTWAQDYVFNQKFLEDHGLKGNYLSSEEFLKRSIADGLLLSDDGMTMVENKNNFNSTLESSDYNLNNDSVVATSTRPSYNAIMRRASRTRTADLVEGLHFYDYSKGSLKMTVEGEMVIGVNVQANIAIVIDARYQMSCFLDGYRRQVIVINVRSNMIIHVEEVGYLSWDLTQVTTENFFMGFSVKQLWQEVYNQGYIANIHSCRIKTIEIVAQYMISVSQQFAVTLSTGSSQAVVIYHNMCIQAIEIIKTRVCTLIDGIKSVVVGGIDVFVSIVKGVFDSFVNLGLSVVHLIGKGLRFKLQILQNLVGGVCRLTYIIRCIKKFFDVKEIIRKIVVSAQIFFSFAASVSGWVDVSVVVYYILLTIHQGSSIQSGVLSSFIDILIQFCSINKERIFAITGTHFLASITAFSKTIINLGFKIDFFVQILQNSWSVLSISISSIIQYLSRVGVEIALSLVTKCLFIIKKIISLPITLFALFMRVVVLVVTGGVKIVTILIPALASFTLNAITFIKNLVKSIISSLFTIITQGLYAAFMKISIFGKIIIAIQQAVIQFERGFSFKVVFKGFNAFKIIKQVRGILSGALSGAVKFTTGIGNVCPCNFKSNNRWRRKVQRKLRRCS